MDTMVSARIPTEMRDLANALLRCIDTTPTQLINAAYEYTLRTGKLPPVEPRERRLTSSQMESLRESFRQTATKIPTAYSEGRTDDEPLEAALCEKQEI